MLAAQGWKLIASAVAILVLVATAAYGEPASDYPRSSERRATGGGNNRRFKVVPGVSPVSGEGPRKRFIVEIERRMHRGGLDFAQTVEDILYDARSWGGNGRLGMKKVDSGPVAFRVTLARPRTVDDLCAPLPTNGIYSCWNGSRAVINSMRWRRGAASYGWEKALDRYRKYLINHEVGHALGHDHRRCPRRGVLAPVMMQQTKGLAACRRNPWPRRFERGPAPA